MMYGRCPWKLSDHHQKFHFYALKPIGSMSEVLCDTLINEQKKISRCPLDGRLTCARFSAHGCRYTSGKHNFQIFQNVTVTPDPINCLTIIFGHWGRIHLVGSVGTYWYVTLALAFPATCWNWCWALALQGDLLGQWYTLVLSAVLLKPPQNINK